jgi:hypothetical protein
MNVPAWERFLRVLLGVALFSCVFTYHGNLRWLGMLGLVPLYTGLLGWCPLRARVSRQRRRLFVRR